MSDAASPDQAARNLVQRVSGTYRDSFESEHRVLSFGEFLELVADNPVRFARSSPQYILDALEHFGRTEVSSGVGTIDRYDLFDAPFDGGNEKVVGNEVTQQELVRNLKHFVRERRVNRLILIHGPNGSAKSSLVACLMRALEAYSSTDEGAVYRFNWVFPAESIESSRIGFDSKTDGRSNADGSYAHLDEKLIDSKLPSEHNDNPLFLVPIEERAELLTGAAADGFDVSDVVAKGDLGHRSRAVFDALMQTYRGDYEQVLRHVQVERFYISKRYRRAAVTVEPQLRVDAGARQLTVDRSLAALPRVLQSQTLFEVFGPLVEGNRGVVEYNDLLKRPMDANKYLLATSEKGTVSLENGEMHIDTVLIASANEMYVEAFKQQPDWASYKGRFSLVRMPYLLDYRAEQQIYDDQLARLTLTKPVAPHTTLVAALWAVMTRLRRPTTDGHPKSIEEVIGDLTPIQKALLYAEATLPLGLSAEQSQQLKLAIPQLMADSAGGTHYEGRYGASPREMKTLILNAAHRDAETLSPLHVFEELGALIADESVYEWLRIEPEGEYHQPAAFIDVVREVYMDRVEREVREATGLVDESEYTRLFERYVSHANHWLRKEKIKDEVTGDMVPPDERLMREIERTLGREDEEKEFRSHIISRIAAFRIDNPDDAVDLERIFPTYFERMREQYYESKRLALQRIKQNLLAFADGQADALDAEQREQVESTLETLETRFGYTVETAKEAIAVLLRERYAEGEDEA